VQRELTPGHASGSILRSPSNCPSPRGDVAVRLAHLTSGRLALGPNRGPQSQGEPATTRICNALTCRFALSGRRDLNSRPLDPQDVGVGVSARHARSGLFGPPRIRAGRPSSCRPGGPQMVPRCAITIARSTPDDAVEVAVDLGGEKTVSALGPRRLFGPGGSGSDLHPIWGMPTPPLRLRLKAWPSAR
jgi:hypothetical protein